MSGYGFVNIRWGLLEFCLFLESGKSYFMIDYRKGDVYCFGLIMLFIVFGFKLLVELFLLSI